MMMQGFCEITIMLKDFCGVVLATRPSSTFTAVQRTFRKAAVNVSRALRCPSMYFYRPRLPSTACTAGATCFRDARTLRCENTTPACNNGQDTTETQPTEPAPAPVSAHTSTATCAGRPSAAPRAAGRSAPVAPVPLRSSMSPPAFVEKMMSRSSRPLPRPPGQAPNRLAERCYSVKSVSSVD